MGSVRPDESRDVLVDDQPTAFFSDLGAEFTEGGGFKTLGCWGMSSLGSPLAKNTCETTGYLSNGCILERRQISKNLH